MKYLDIKETQEYSTTSENNNKSYRAVITDPLPTTIEIEIRPIQLKQEVAAWTAQAAVEGRSE